MIAAAPAHISDIMLFVKNQHWVYAFCMVIANCVGVLVALNKPNTSFCMCMMMLLQIYSRLFV